MTKGTIITRLKNSYLELSQSTIFPYLIIVLVFFCFWFYWTQLRVISVRRTCYQEVFTPSVENAKWTRGKVWRILYPSYDMAKTTRMDGGFWGWGYPPADTEMINYKQCLIWRGITGNLLDLN